MRKGSDNVGRAERTGKACAWICKL